jgi:hypothetical protein
MTSALASNADPEAEKYTAMRLAFARGPGYNAGSLVMRESALSREAHQLWNSGQGEATVAKIQQMLEEYPLSLLANAMMAETCAKLAEHTQDGTREAELVKMSKEHQDRYNLLVASITKGSLCSTPEDHCAVINTSEEYMVLYSMHIQRKTQALAFHNHVPYDVLVGTLAEGSEKTLYFDVSPFFDMTPFNAMGSQDPSASQLKPPAQP